MMLRASLLATLAGAFLLTGCTVDGNRYDNRTYAADGWGYRPYGSYSYGRPYGYYSDSYYRRERDRRDDDRSKIWPGDGTRLARPESDTVCDRRTRVCYKDGRISDGETRQYFGNRAAERVERVQRRHDDRDLFLPRRNVVCNKENDTCYRNGRPDRETTRRYFGRDDARRVAQDENRERRRGRDRKRD